MSFAPFTESAEVFRCGWGLKVETYKKLKNKGTFYGKSKK